MYLYSKDANPRRLEINTKLCTSNIMWDKPATQLTEVTGQLNCATFFKAKINLYGGCVWFPYFQSS